MFIDRMINVERYQIRIEKTYQETTDILSEWMRYQNRNGVTHVRWTDKGVFYMEYNNELGFIRHFEKGPAYLSVQLEEENKGINLHVKVRPNSIFSIFTLVFSIGSVVIFGLYFYEGVYESLKGAVLFLMGGITSFVVGWLLRIKMKNRFENNLALFFDL